MGIEPVVEISAEHGQGVGDLLDEIVILPARGVGQAGRAAPENGEAEPENRRWRRHELPGQVEGEIGVAIIGRPNVGKSSLVNRLLREERSLVSDMPGTTRDAVDSLLRWHRREFRIVDTAGIRRPGKVARSAPVESLSVMIARRAVEAADVAVVVIDAVEGATEQDGAIAGEAERAGCGIIVAVNKWDLMKDARAGLREDVRRPDAAPDEVPGLRAGAAHLGDDGRADAEAARDDRSRGRSAEEAA